MREIKFRAWAMVTTDGKMEMLDWDTYKLSIGEWLGKSDPDITLMQFTGLRDKNGKEIYEGDVFGQLAQLRCVVERMDDGAWKLVFSDKRIQPWSITDPRIARSDIIGNIHENPELLTPNRGEERE